MKTVAASRIIVSTCLFFSASSSALAEEGSSISPDALRGHLGFLDWSVIIIYAVAMVSIGVYYAYRAKTAEDYYLGGRKMRPVLVGLSLFATLISTISYLAVPGEVMKHGPVVVLNILALPIIFLLVGYGIIPFMMRLPIVSAYEILEKRFGRPVRIFGSVLFLSIRFVWMGLVLYSASKVVIPALGLSTDAIPYMVVVMGTITVFYAALGGLQAVVVTDAIQAVILFGGAFLCVIVVSVKLGGFGWIPTEWSPNWDVQPFFSTDPRVRVTVCGTWIHTMVWWICTAGSDQMAIQQYISTRDAPAARRAFLVNNIAGAGIEVLLALLGFALLGFFLSNPQLQIGELNLQKDADSLFPFFIVNFLGYGLAGIVISGMLAAAMSSLSAGINSTATVLFNDVVSLILRRDLPETAKIRFGRAISGVVGVIIIISGILMGKVPGNLYEVTSKTNGLFIAPLFGLFFLTFFVPFATPMGAVFGSLYGLLAAFVVAFWDLTGGPTLSFQWILAMSLLIDIITGCLFSLVPTRNRSAKFKRVLAAAYSVPLIFAIALFVRACMK